MKPAQPESFFYWTIQDWIAEHPEWTSDGGPNGAAVLALAQELAKGSPLGFRELPPMDNKELEAFVEALPPEKLAPEFLERVLQQLPKRRLPFVSICDRCDGCGWYEGGRTIKTSCEKCGGTGLLGPVGDRGGVVEPCMECEHCGRIIPVDAVLEARIAALTDMDVCKVVAQCGVIATDKRGFYVDVVAREGRAVLRAALGLGSPREGT